MSTEAFMENLMEQFAGIGSGLLLLFTFWAGLGIFRNFGYYRMAKKVNVRGAGFIFFPIIWVEPVAGLMKQSYRFYKGKKLDLSGPMFFWGLLPCLLVLFFFAYFSAGFADIDGSTYGSAFTVYICLLLAGVAIFIRKILAFYAYFWIFKNYFPYNATVIFVSCLLYQFLGSSILSSLGLWIVPLLCPDLFWIFAWIGSGRVPASITGVGYSEEQPFWEEWEMSLRR